jgi:hypothetical protein
MSMNQWLADAYGTAGAGEDLEKIAQAEMAQQMAQQEGVDLSQLTEEQIAQLGSEVLGGQGGAQQQGAQQGAPQGQHGQQQMGGQPGGQEQGGEIDPSQLTEEHVQQAQQILEAAQQGQQVDPQMVQEAQAVMQIVEQMQGGGQQQPGAQEMAKVAEAQAKFEEADFLGRVMAHSFHAETEKIAAQKQANAMHNMGQAAMRHGGAALGAAKHHIGNAAGAAGQHFAKHPGQAAAAGAVGGAAAMHGAHRMMDKQAAVSVIEKAAMQQAANILQANGIDPATGQPAQQQAPQAPAIAPAGGGVQTGAGPQAALGDLVEKRAHQILRGLGYTI